MKPSVGVIIPVYRSAPYLRGCIESVLAQTYPVDQIVIVDDCGDDDSVPVARQTLDDAGREFRLIRQPRNGGLGRARNTGLAAVQTDLVWFLDSDDEADADFVARIVAAMTAHDAQIGVTRTRRVDENGVVLQIDEASPPAAVLTGEQYAREILCGRAKAYACTKLFRREILGERPWAQDQAYEDFAISVRLSLSVERVALVAEPLYRYLYREGSLSTALSPSTLDLFVVEDDVRQLICATTRDAGWWRDFVGFRYREVLTSVAHVAMRSAHASGHRSDLYRTALTRVRDDISLGDLPTLWAGKYLREMIFAVLVKLVPGLYSAVLRWR